MTTQPQPTPTSSVRAPSTGDAKAARASHTTERTEWVVQYRHPDDTQWLDTVDSPLQTLAGARSHRSWYDREVGLPSRLVERHTSDTVLDH